MYVRTKKVKRQDGTITEYAYLVESVWNAVKKKEEQKSIAALGNVATLPSDRTIEKIILALDKFAEKQGFASLSAGVVLTDISDEDVLGRTYDYGNILLAQHLLKRLSLDKIISKVAKTDTQKELSAEKVLASVTAILAYQLTDRRFASELATFNWYQDKVFLPDKLKLERDDLYRSLDVMARNKDKIEREYYERNKDLFNQQLDLVLFDTTSVYYWGKRNKPAEENSILQHGHSKDKRRDLKQVIAGVLMTEEAVPIAHEVFPGNQLDLTSFPEIVEKVKKKYSLKRVIFITDRGMISEKNIKILEDTKVEYLIGVRMRKLPAVLKRILVKELTADKMEKVKDNLYSKEVKLGNLKKEEIEELVKGIYKRGQQGKLPIEEKQSIRKRIVKRRYFVQLNPKVAAHEFFKRKYFRQVIKNKITYSRNKDWIVKNGYKKYLKFGPINPQLDEERLKAEEYYDGRWILVTNNQTLKPEQATRWYKTLRAVEDGFRELKSLVNIRPIYHFKEERIKAHIFMSFLNLVLRWYVYNQLGKESHIPGKRFIKAINDIKAISVDEKIPLYVRSRVDKKTKENMKKLHMKLLAKVIVDKRVKQTTAKPGRPKKKPDSNQRRLL